MEDQIFKTIGALIALFICYLIAEYMWSDVIIEYRIFRAGEEPESQQIEQDENYAATIEENDQQFARRFRSGR